MNNCWRICFYVKSFSRIYIVSLTLNIALILIIYVSECIILFMVGVISGALSYALYAIDPVKLIFEYVSIWYNIVQIILRYSLVISSASLSAIKLISIIVICFHLEIDHDPYVNCLSHVEEATVQRLHESLCFQCN